MPLPLLSAVALCFVLLPVSPSPATKSVPRASRARNQTVPTPAPASGGSAQYHSANYPQKNLTPHPDLLARYLLNGMAAAPALAGRIAVGKPAVAGNFRYTVALKWQRDGPLMCAGSLVQPQWVVTAAHCVVNNDRFQPIAPWTNELLVGLGVDHWKEEEPSARWMVADRAIVHKDFADVEHDIALLHLPEAAPLSAHIKTLDLPGPRDEVLDNLRGQTAYISGWGAMSAGSNEMSPVLLTGTTLFYPNDDCSRYYFEPAKSRNFLCTKPPKAGTSACPGDSGGPVVGKIRWFGDWTLLGIISQTRCDSFSALVSTRVGAYMDWVHREMARKPAPNKLCCGDGCTEVLFY